MRRAGDAPKNKWLANLTYTQAFKVVTTSTIIMRHDGAATPIVYAVSIGPIGQRARKSRSMLVVDAPNDR